MEEVPALELGKSIRAGSGTNVEGSRILTTILASDEKPLELPAAKVNSSFVIEESSGGVYWMVASVEIVCGRMVTRPCAGLDRRR